MNSIRTFLPILRFSARSIPLLLWVITGFLIYTPFLVMFDWNQGEIRGFEAHLFSPSLFIFPVVVGRMFFKELRSSPSEGYLAIPFGEFLLARPILRTQAYLPRVALCFAFVLSAPLVNLGLSLRQPAMQLYVYQDTDASKKLAEYQAAFPNSSLITKGNANHQTLLVPAGYTLVACWQVFLTAIIALATQASLFLKRSRMMGLIFAPFLILLISLLLFLPDGLALVGRSFLFFASHLAVTAALSFALVVGVQWLALKKVSKLEII